MCSDFPERNASEGRKERFPSREFRPAGWVWSPTILISDLGTITRARSAEEWEDIVLLRPEHVPGWGGPGLGVLLRGRFPGPSGARKILSPSTGALARWGGGPGTWGLVFSVAGRADGPSQPRWPRVPGCGRGGRGEGRIEAT